MSGNRRIDQDDQPDGLKHNPFAALRKPGAPAGSPKEPVPADDDPVASDGAERLVVRREKKGRGGKTVTRITGLSAKGSDLTELARDLKRALGCGATVDGDDVLLQGALTERAAEWLRTRRGARVTIGN